MFEVDDGAVIIVEIDYQYEVVGVSTTGTLRLANKEYFDDVAGYGYAECINSVPQFSRSLSGERLGDYRSTIGTVEIDNADGEFDYVLGLAIDGSEVRVYWGDRGWSLANFRLIFSALATKAVAPSADRISIQLKDATAFLNKSIGGSPVGGSGPNADQLRPVNFGYLHQIACLVYDTATLTYVHSDSSSQVTVANIVRDNGIEVNFVDNGDGTFYLEQSPVNPTGAITADVLAVASGSPADTDERRFSHAMRYLVGELAGFAAAGRYLGPSISFTPLDDDDYFVGISLDAPRNIVDLLGEMVDSGNAFWCITRLGQFTYGRLNPHELEAMDGSPSTAVEIEADDIDDGSLKIDHTSPKYYKLQAYMSRNWSSQTVFATSLTPDERAILTRKGLYRIQLDSAGTSYAEAPELYSLSLEVSPPLDTLLSGFDDETDVVSLDLWMERRRTMFLPWLETISCTVGIEFYELEIGDVVRLTLPRYGLGTGELFQVVGVDIQLSKAKVVLQLLRRRTSEFVPPGFERDTVDDTRLITGILVPQPPPIKPPDPVVVIDPRPPLFPFPFPINFIHRPLEDLFWWDTFTVGDGIYRRVYHAIGQVQSFGDFNRAVAMDSTGTLAVVGVSNDYLNLGSSVSGHLDIYERSSGSWSQIATLDDSGDVNTAMLGWVVGVADDGTIVTSEIVGNRVHVFTRTGPTTWSHALIHNTANVNSESDCTINRDGNVIVVIESQGKQEFFIYKLITGTWTLQQTVSVAPQSVRTCAISADGDFIAISGSDTNVPANLNWRLYESGGILTTWTLHTVYVPTTDNGNTRVYENQQIAMSADKSMIAVVAPNDQDGAVGGSVILFRKSPTTAAYSQIAFLRAESTSTGLLLGSVALSDNGSKLFVGETYFDGTGTQEGRLFFVDHAADFFGGGPFYMADDFTVIANPYAGTINRQRFGEAIACGNRDSGDGNTLVVVSGDFNNDGTDTVDFFER